MKIIEVITKTPRVYYHGTKSEPFDRFEPEKAVKGERYWNPLGNAMYVTDQEYFAGNFGGNVHDVPIQPA